MFLSGIRIYNLKEECEIVGIIDVPFLITDWSSIDSVGEYLKCYS